MPQPQVGTIVPVSIGNNNPSVNWKESCQCHLGTIVLFSLGNNCANLTRDNHTNVTWEQSCHSHLGTIVPVLLGNNCVSLTSHNHFSGVSEQLCLVHWHDSLLLKLTSEVSCHVPGFWHMISTCLLKHSLV